MMPRVLIVDDSPTARRVLANRLAERGYEVEEAPDGITAAELALARPPAFVVTDLWMPGISGVQLCRLLRAEPRTSHVPVVLITGESQRRSRFWARTAGAAAYVVKGDPAELFEILERLAREAAPRVHDPVGPVSRMPMQDRLFQRLDAALFESVVAGKVRSLAHEDGGAEGVFRGLAALASDVTSYRWLALHVRSPARLFVHTTGTEQSAVLDEVRAAFSLRDAVDAIVVVDHLPIAGRVTPPVVAEVCIGEQIAGAVAMGPNGRGASRDDRELVSILGRELGGALRVVSLVEEMRTLAMSDPLTGLLNRRAFTEEMRRGIAAFERHGTPMSVALLDVDHFKQVNDTHGHDGGDAVLIGIADLLRARARTNDVVARWGGEELVIGFSHTTMPGAALAAERVRQAILGHAFRLPGGANLTVTASVGVAAVREGEALEALIARADRAMYLAKSRGRNQCVVDEAPA